VVGFQHPCAVFPLQPAGPGNPTDLLTLPHVLLAVSHQFPAMQRSQGLDSQLLRLGRRLGHTLTPHVEHEAGQRRMPQAAAPAADVDSSIPALAAPSPHFAGSHERTL
jgi:hypothetical protein